MNPFWIWVCLMVAIFVVFVLAVMVQVRRFNADLERRRRP